MELRGVSQTEPKSPISEKVEELKIQCGSKILSLKGVLIVKDLPLPKQCVTSALPQYCENFSNIKVPPYKTSPDLLIGQNNAKLIVTREIVEFNDRDILLSRCLLSWSLHGKNSNSELSHFPENFCMNISEVNESKSENLEGTFQKVAPLVFFTFLSVRNMLGTMNHRSCYSPPLRGLQRPDPHSAHTINENHDSDQYVWNLVFVSIHFCLYYIPPYPYLHIVSHLMKFRQKILAEGVHTLTSPT
ncbi:hypothetical protein QAD02_000713 [Eretmocerus hayati]|uniref:Uncharacterized protein n=1 Tax=Eretmocerus hayati TaxID=131215 RepID=A0ACC2NGI6_9HYME|nr:hypothetical protein QAD02_000713 [Eretmocerus hayati]